jgi:CRP-like cAMP-binding protein
MIESGEVEVLRGETRVSRLGPGEIFGEMALVTGAPRTATVKALGTVKLLALDKPDYDELLQELPEIRKKIRDLVAERSGDLAARSLVTRDQADAWKVAAASHITDADLTPTSREIQETAKAHGAAALGIWLGILLDGIPESLVIGTSVHGFSSFAWPLIAGVFLANLPEAMSSSMVMRRQNYSILKIFLMWTSITAVTGVGAMAGNMFLQQISPWHFTIIAGAAAGAMLTMIAETMLPEAYEQGGAVVGLSTLMGFLAALFVKSIA